MTFHFGDLGKIDWSDKEAPPSNYLMFAKRGLDILLCVAALICLSPCLLLIAILIKLDSQGPVIFCQQRNGYGGRAFTIFKFRTMTNQLEVGFKQCEANDRRVTRLGKFLRKTSIDELPQLFNILLGDMSVVGPRPHPLELDRQYSVIIYNYMRRYSTKPGLTGWAQVLGRRGATPTVEIMAERLAADLAYVRRVSFLFDLLIILKTIPVILAWRKVH